MKQNLGTLDICIAQINPDDPDGYKLKATTGDLHLGTRWYLGHSP